MVFQRAKLLRILDLCNIVFKVKMIAQRNQPLLGIIALIFSGSSHVGWSTGIDNPGDPFPNVPYDLDKTLYDWVLVGFRFSLEAPLCPLFYGDAFLSG